MYGIASNTSIGPRHGPKALASHLNVYKKPMMRNVIKYGSASCGSNRVYGMAGCTFSKVDSRKLLHTHLARAACSKATSFREVGDGRRHPACNGRVDVAYVVRDG